MAIKVHLEDILKERGMTSKELCALIGVLRLTCQS